MVKKKSNEELTEDLKNLESKIRTLEKFLNDEKKQKDLRVEKLETTSKEFDNLIKSTNLEVKGLKTSFEDKLEEQDDLLQQKVGELNSFKEQYADFKEQMEEQLAKVAEKDLLVEKLRNQVKEKDILINEKSTTLKNKEKELKDTVNQMAKIKADYESLQSKYDQTKNLEKELKQKLGSVEKEYLEFKSKEEPVMAQNDSIKRILQSNDQGKIYLAVVEAHPNNITLDDISDSTGLSAVVVKSSLNGLEELGVIEFNPATREIKLPKE